MDSDFIRLTNYKNKEYLFRVDRIRFAEDTDDGCEVYYDYEENDIRWYGVRESVREIAKKINALNNDRIKVS